MEMMRSLSMADCMQKRWIWKSILVVKRLISAYFPIERPLMRPFIIMTGIFFLHARRRKFGQSSVSMRMMALGSTILTMRSVMTGRSKGKKICPSASGMILRAMRWPVAVTTETTTISSGYFFFSSRTIGLAATTSPTDAACTQMALWYAIRWRVGVGMMPALCFRRS